MTTSTLPRALRRGVPMNTTLSEDAVAAAIEALGLRAVLRAHWPEYGMEAAEIGVFMVSVCLFATLLEHPASPVRAVAPDPAVRRLLMGSAMGLTALTVISSPWGKQSGAHLNPAVTLTFLRLGKIAPWDAVFYIIAQFGGALAGVLTAAAVLGSLLADPAVNYAVTAPGAGGTVMALAVEFALSFGLMAVILVVTNRPRTAPYTAVLVAALLVIFITVASPLSGPSMNPARTFGSAASASVWTALWVYFTAPPLGMLAAAEAYRRWSGGKGAICAKLDHHSDKRCIFVCGYKLQTFREETSS